MAKVRFELFLDADPKVQDAALEEIERRFGRKPRRIRAPAASDRSARLARFYQVSLKVPAGAVWDVARGLVAVDGVLDVDPEPPQGRRVDRTIRSVERAADGEDRKGRKEGLDPKWFHTQTKFPEALAWVRAQAEAGEGNYGRKPRDLRIGQLDTGYSDHPEITRLQKEKGHNFVTPPFWIRLLRKNWPRIARDPLVMAPPFSWASHGTSSGSVIIGSTGDRQALAKGHTDRVDGVLPEVDLVPYRIADSIISTGLNLASGAAQAIEDGCKVLTASHATIIRSRQLQEVVAHSYESGVIWVAAAGSNLVRIRTLWVYPARFRSVISAAASTVDGRPWKKTHGGPTVDICAPGRFIYRPFAYRSFMSFGWVRYGYGWSSGSTFAAPLVAAAAALWIAHHGDDELTEKYSEGWQRVEAFRALLRSTAAPHADPADVALFGPGLLDVEALLRAPLPDPASLERVVEFPDDAPEAAPEDRITQKELFWLTGYGKVETADHDADELFAYVERNRSERAAAMLAPLGTDGSSSPEDDDYAQRNPRSQALKSWVKNSEWSPDR